MENKKNVLIGTTIAIIIINIIVYLFNKTYQNIFSLDSLIFYGSLIIGILSIFLISKNTDKFKNTIIIFNILFVLSGNIIGLYNMVTIIKSKKYIENKNLNGD